MPQIKKKISVNKIKQRSKTIIKIIKIKFYKKIIIASKK